ncbi:PAX-interacting protein 1-like [Dendrobates tinctorius]|uniref:PAX-interacting protein 1-like n=1 Tax=Dendrobates tinctorius TaxID=92724 RepID=UPI003CC96A7B
MIAVFEDYFLMGCVFAVADYPEQMSDKQLLATWKWIIQTHGGTVDPTLTSRSTHLLCESQVRSMHVQAIKGEKAMHHRSLAELSLEEEKNGAASSNSTLSSSVSTRRKAMLLT